MIVAFGIIVMIVADIIALIVACLTACGIACIVIDFSILEEEKKKREEGI